MEADRALSCGIPQSLQHRTALFERHFASLNHPLRAAVCKLLVVSDYACHQLDTLTQLLKTDEGMNALSCEDYHRLANELLTQARPASFSRQLRQFRHRHFLRLLLREYAGFATTANTMASWSHCADALILTTLRFCHQDLVERYGMPCDAGGNPVCLYTIAMGKLGGQELNYSSDIDLIFAYSAAGHTQGPQSISNQQYFTKIVQMFMQLFQEPTPEGFVFRVDLRLRPNGESGALVSSLTALETYYQEQGRDWERYAMAKARVICAPEDEPPAWFERLIVPFVYRRYVDFSVIESLRSMKALIEREIQLNPRLNDIKRGLGGIREIEFVIQNIQLIRGGRLPPLRQPNALNALDALRRCKLLPRTGILREAYLFLRKLENCLQSENDQQTHALPTNPVKQDQIALAMEYESYDELLNRLHQFQRIVSTTFHTAMGKGDAYEDRERLLSHQLTSLWQGHVESAMAVNLLSSLGYRNAERCYQMIHAFRHAPRCRRLNQAARMRLDRFMVLLLQELTQVPDAESVLLQVMHLLENIVGRSAYLALLAENPQALKELLHWFAESPFITSLLVNYPFLMEVLLDKERNWRAPSRNQLAQQLQNQLSHVSEIDLQEDVLRQFKLTQWLLAARAEMDGRMDGVKAGRFLADVAEVIVIQVINHACRELSLRYPEMAGITHRFDVIAYGKLGSMEMNYNSDLDLVFVHDVPFEQEGLVNRLSQKIIHMLTTRSQFGILYAVDTRLRPSGSAGLLVSPLTAFLEYQRRQAWTWEHQALVRCRLLYGNRKSRHAFLQLKKDILLLPREWQKTAEEVQTMREKMSRNLAKVEGRDIKHARGGLIDLEFLVQFLVLCSTECSLARYTNTLQLLQQLAIAKKITPSRFNRLKEAYKTYHKWLHHQMLGLHADHKGLSGHQRHVRDISAAIYRLSRD
ncbi:bifunctional [glutamate--ammonia ligase]-adenylyl-L-tyrosine phosphorylase/[glutamate--ammonia-ligase] adenylyltransferase [Legionella taurinensis]|uniref:Bifunctional [glutamate--ammonia ligase]-adenylyl-L-tyrosine phosphorylase/[glutamate--ammonia-ligase] adenylyltransferase n=1 Tax=Legionella taurinensis TaxID=70611 RepID=A0A3A5LJR0_9GAMM|nr:bifunctional [glutamate--ammonia ligase]-adenylyl-L-tyrosine phosphorylase/[glutamate--ammonia-ligase] adenylyltransferase [Legionella taurinensis]PUT45534.1 bifunctional [glutamate--ammonia ligase]-adenylyl-L-tyrosine phosphorylase/[glutamate--ammonia-ligase] adenylyltransferase [Legionella taurinensis]PUT46891.1 bifunctional [glutamate--ammonia ligase]-adenylyl-L-tyrosine phosphorylase/[glutamate--ammonia-ligase] adenylyltransferase [Legionella taurinensis]PUT49301.1 bifunctional [glutamate